MIGLKNCSLNILASGCASVGRAVTYNTRGPRSESSHRQKLYWTFVYCELYWKDENKEKETGNGPFLKKNNLERQQFFFTILECVVNCARNDAWSLFHWTACWPNQYFAYFGQHKVLVNLNRMQFGWYLRNAIRSTEILVNFGPTERIFYFDWIHSK